MRSRKDFGVNGPHGAHVLWNVGVALEPEIAGVTVVRDSARVVALPNMKSAKINSVLTSLKSPIGLRG